MNDDPRRDTIAQAIERWYVSAPTLMTPRMRAEELADVVLAALDAADPSWRSQAVYRHALSEAIGHLAVLGASMQHPAAQRALYRARELLRHRRDGTTPAGRNDIDQDTARESGL